MGLGASVIAARVCYLYWVFWIMFLEGGVGNIKISKPNVDFKFCFFQILILDFRCTVCRILLHSYLSGNKFFLFPGRTQLLAETELRQQGEQVEAYCVSATAHFHISKPESSSTCNSNLINCIFSTRNAFGGGYGPL
ncbi:hypothetical protein F5X97DRAFT_49276 [Nemania serpens]|nr:hypothetical protein F5X97DRAFT_49276 [Nemania serpens]